MKDSATQKTPDIYLENEFFKEEIQKLKEEFESKRIEGNKIKQKWEKMKKEADHYKMHYSR